jgi:hypothetical protein
MRLSLTTGRCSLPMGVPENSVGGKIFSLCGANHFLEGDIGIGSPPSRS